ncbi:hypothetical protein MLD38_012154 [Melastoma candidum]|uniref:Uncharacterized protein n=1 Tax=Melastoma candidum TaxID=119954 RepID=A0ACB9R8Z8_9MYRT|nr:hypothetical protein MLD38_012154 [Melastoma candidum]
MFAGWVNDKFRSERVEFRNLSAIIYIHTFHVTLSVVSQNVVRPNPSNGVSLRSRRRPPSTPTAGAPPTPSPLQLLPGGITPATPRPPSPSSPRSPDPTSFGRVADWTRALNNPSNKPNKPSAADASFFDFTSDESFFPLIPGEDSSFRLVDSSKPLTHRSSNIYPKFNPRHRFHHNRSQLPQRSDEEVEAKRLEAEKERAWRDRLYNVNRPNAGGQRREAAVFKSSVDIQPEWNMLD